MMNRLQVLLLAAAFFFGCVGMQQFRIWAISHERDEALKKVTLLEVSLKQQNLAVDRLSRIAAGKDKLIKSAVESAKKMKNEYNKKSKIILAKKIPKNCDEAILWAISQAKVIAINGSWGDYAQWIRMRLN